MLHLFGRDGIFYMHFNSLIISIRQWCSLCNPLAVPLWANSVVTLFVNSKGWSWLRVVFSQTKKCTVIPFSDANVYATSMTQRNVSKATVPDRMVWLAKPACVMAAVRLSKALLKTHTQRRQAICTSVLPASKTPVNQKIYHLNTLHLYQARTRKRTKKELPNSYIKLLKYRHPIVRFLQ